MKLKLPEFEVLILGAGPAGMSAADYALKRGARVVMIEGGPRELVNLESVKDSQTEKVKPVGGLGGQSKIWGRQIVTPDKIQIESLKLELGADNLWAAKLESHLSYLSNLFSIPINSQNVYFEDEVLCDEHFETKYSIYLKDPNLVSYFQASINSLTILEDIEIEGFTVKENGQLQIETSQGIIPVNSNQKLILALGTIETTTTLMRSNIANADKLGVGLQDHPSGYVMSFKGKHIKGIRRGPLRRYRGHVLKRKFEYRSKTNTRLGIVEFHYDLRGNSDWDRQRRICSLLRALWFYLNAISLRLFGLIALSVPVIHVWFQFQQEPSKDNRIELSNGKTTITWNLSEADKALIEEVESVLLKCFEKKGVEIYKGKSAFGQIYGEFKSVYHPSGTIPANSNKNGSFCDSFGVLHDLRNVGIASAAILPTTSWINPTYLVMAMARLTAEELLST